MPGVRQRTPLRPVDGRRPVLHPVRAGRAQAAPVERPPTAAGLLGDRSTADDRADRPYLAGADSRCRAAARSVEPMHLGGAPVRPAPPAGRHDRSDQLGPAATVPALRRFAVARVRAAGHPEYCQPALDRAADEADMVATARGRACRDRTFGVARLRDHRIAAHQTSASHSATDRSGRRRALARPQVRGNQVGTQVRRPPNRRVEVRRPAAAARVLPGRRHAAVDPTRPIGDLPRHHAGPAWQALARLPVDRAHHRSAAVDQSLVASPRRQRWPSRVSSTRIPWPASSSRKRSDAAQSRAERAASRAASSAA